MQFPPRPLNGSGLMVRPIAQPIVRPILLMAGGQPPLAVSGTLPAGSTSAAYSAGLTASGGLTPYTWTLQSGSLPPGLALNASTGVVSGTPTVAQTANYTFTLRVTGAAGGFVDSAQSVKISGLGAELITNGAFATDTNWTKAATWTIAGGVAVATTGNAADRISQAITGPSSVQYEVTFTMPASATRSLAFVLIGATNVTGTSRNSAGTYTEVVTAPASLATFAMEVISAPLDTTVDNVSLRQVIP